MRFIYENPGDILYGIEVFKFRYQGKNTAVIEVLSLIEDGQFAYEAKIEEPNISTEFQEFTSASYDFKRSLNIDSPTVFNTKQEALQDAINVINKIMKQKYERTDEING